MAIELSIADCGLRIADCGISDVRQPHLLKYLPHGPLRFARTGQNGPFLVGPWRALPGEMNPRAVELQKRTQKFATEVISFCERLPQNAAVRMIVEQLLDSAGATNSNYRATCRAKSPADFISKIGTALEEADESKGWLELLVSSKFTTIEEAGALIQEADELTAIFVASRKTAEINKEKREALEKEVRRRAK